MAEEVRTHNETVLGTLKEGDLVEFPRVLYSHWGVYVGDNNIVHLTSVDKPDNISSGKLFTISGVDCDKACVKEEDFFHVAENSRAEKKNYKDDNPDYRTLLPLDIKQRALDKKGPISYNVLWNNCEHFAVWCRYDKKTSEQATAVMGAGITAAGHIAAEMVPRFMYTSTDVGGRETRDLSKLKHS